jgi:hypothetical protein
MAQSWESVAWRRVDGNNSARIDLVNGNFQCTVHTTKGVMTTPASDYEEARQWCDEALAGGRPE